MESITLANAEAIIEWLALNRRGVERPVWAHSNRDFVILFSDTDEAFINSAIFDWHLSCFNLREAAVRLHRHRNRHVATMIAGRTGLGLWLSGTWEEATVWDGGVSFSRYKKTSENNGTW